MTIRTKSPAVACAAIAGAWFSEKFNVIASTDANGTPLLQKAFSDTDLGLLANVFLQARDKLGGLKDGMIHDPDHCSFDPATPRCTRLSKFFSRSFRPFSNSVHVTPSTPGASRSNVETALQ